MLFDDDGFITNEREYCARIAADFSARGRLNRKTVHSIFGGMDVSQAISLGLANPMAYYHDNVNKLLSSLLSRGCKESAKLFTRSTSRMANSSGCSY